MLSNLKLRARLILSGAAILLVGFGAAGGYAVWHSFEQASQDAQRTVVAVTGHSGHRHPAAAPGP